MLHKWLLLLIPVIATVPAYLVSQGDGLGAERWSRLSEQIFRVDKWSLCRG